MFGLCFLVYELIFVFIRIDVSVVGKEKRGKHMERKKHVATIVTVLLTMLIVAILASAYIILDDRQRSVEAHQKSLDWLYRKNQSDPPSNPNAKKDSALDKADQEDTLQDGDSSALTPSGSDPTETGQGEFQGFIPILMYHSVNETHPVNSVVIRPSEFKEQLSYLKQQGYTALSVYDVVEAIYGAKNLPEKPLLITMDDGYQDNYEYAFPILQELEMKATIFVVTSQMGETPGKSKHFTWEEAQEMVDSGFVTIQSHTHDLHHKLDTPEGPQSAMVSRKLLQDGTEESEEEYRERIYDDLMTSKRLIQKHTTDHVVTFAYPYGVYSDQVLDIVKEAGFLLLFTTEKGLFRLEDSVYTIPRVNVPSGRTGADIEREIEELRESLDLEAVK